MILKSNKTVKAQVERRRFQSRYHRISMSLEIYQGTVRGQFKSHRAFLLTARQYGEVVFRQLADGALFAVFARRSLGEGGHGTNFIEHYACRGTELSRC